MIETLFGAEHCDTTYRGDDQNYFIRIADPQPDRDSSLWISAKYPYDGLSAAPFYCFLCLVDHMLHGHLNLAGGLVELPFLF
jgi:hypothetical protein